MRIFISIDALVDFTPGGNLPVPDGDKIVAPTNDLLENGDFDLKIAIKECHPADHVSFASNHPGKSVLDVIQVNGKEQILWPDHCVEGTPGAEFIPGLKVELFDVIIPKGGDSKVDGYSGVFDDLNRSTGLLECIKSAAAQHGSPLNEVKIYFGNLATDYCVKGTGVHLAKLGFETFLVYDACRAVNAFPGAEEAALREMRDAGVEVVNSWDITGSKKVPTLPSIEDAYRQDAGRNIQL